MKRARCVLYDPPSPGHPALAVVFSSEGQVLTTRIVPSTGSLEVIMAELITEVRSAGGYVLERLESVKQHPDTSLMN